jgi:uncharacterized protein (DUF4213/DUF364 family)
MMWINNPPIIGPPTGDGSALTDLNASELTSGTVPLARLTDITDAQIAEAAGIEYSKLLLTSSVVDGDIVGVGWSKIDKTESSLADLVTRSASDLSSGTLPDARFPATLPASSGVNLTALTLANVAGLAAALALLAPLASPVLTGVPTAPTADPGEDTDQLATTAFVAALSDALTSATDVLLAVKANLASPALTGTPTAPTATPGTDTTQLATTAFTRAEVAAIVAAAPSTLDTLNELAAALGNDPNFAATLTTALGLKAPLASPTLTGTPTVPTAAPTTNTTQAASTAFVEARSATVEASVALKAPLSSPALTGVPTAPTAAAATNTTQVATTAFATVADALKANLASPTFTGTPAAPTAAPGTDTTQIATTAFAAALAALKADLASPEFTGIPTAPTADSEAFSTQIATTEYVDIAVGNLSEDVNLIQPAISWSTGITAQPFVAIRNHGWVCTGTFTFTLRRANADGDDNRQIIVNGGSGVITVARTSPDTIGNQGETSFTLQPGDAAFFLANAASDAWYVLLVRATAASLASPAFTGTPTAPTAAAGTNTTQVATTAYAFGQASDAANLTTGTLPSGRFPSTLPAVSGVNLTALTLANVTGLTSALALISSGTHGRLTLTSGVAVPMADQLAATTVYWTPKDGNTIELWNGSAWVVVTFAEIALALGTMTAGLGYDVFGYLSAGALAIEKLAWTSGTARATALALQNGRLVKSGDPTRRYLGAFQAATTTTTEDSFAKRLVSNYFNRANRPARKLELTTATWTDSTVSWRQANLDAANQIAWFTGIEDYAIPITVTSGVAHTVANTLVGSGFKIDAANGVDSNAQNPTYYSQVANVIIGNTCVGKVLAGLGGHFAAWVEFTGAATATFQGSGIHAGISADIQG